MRRIYQRIYFTNLYFVSSAIINTAGMMGPMLGFVLGSYLARTYVDIGSVDLGMRRHTSTL